MINKIGFGWNVKTGDATFPHGDTGKNILDKILTLPKDSFLPTLANRDGNLIYNRSYAA